MSHYNHHYCSSFHHHIILQLFLIIYRFHILMNILRTDIFLKLYTTNHTKSYKIYYNHQKRHYYHHHILRPYYFVAYHYHNFSTIFLNILIYQRMIYIYSQVRLHKILSIHHNYLNFDHHIISFPKQNHSRKDLLFP